MERFRLIREEHCKIWELESRKKYRIPANKIPVTHIHVRAGKISFFASLNGETGDIKTKRGTFLSVPLWAKFIEFPDFFKGPNGYHYGEPRWYAVKIC